MANACYPSTLEAKARRLKVLGQFGLHKRDYIFSKYVNQNFNPKIKIVVCDSWLDQWHDVNDTPLSDEGFQDLDSVCVCVRGLKLAI